MRRTPCTAIAWMACSVLATGVVFAQGPRSMPGSPVQRMGSSSRPNTGMGAPGAPMARMGRGAGPMQAPAAPARRSYGGYGGVGGVMSSQNFRAQNFAGQARNVGGMRSSSGIVSGMTQGRASLPANPR